METSNGPITILTEMIGLWENSGDEVPELDSEPVDVKSDGPEESIEDRPTEVPERTCFVSSRFFEFRSY